MRWAGQMEWKGERMVYGECNGRNVKDRHHLGKPKLWRKHNIKLYLQEIRYEHGLNLSEFG